MATKPFRRVNRRFPGRLSVRVSRAQGYIVVRREVTLHNGVAAITITARRATSQYKQSPWRARAVDKSANRMAGDTGKPKLFIALLPSRLDRSGRRAGESVGSGRFFPPLRGRHPGGFLNLHRLQSQTRRHTPDEGRVVALRPEGGPSPRSGDEVSCPRVVIHLG